MHTTTIFSLVYFYFYYHHLTARAVSSLLISYQCHGVPSQAHIQNVHHSYPGTKSITRCANLCSKDYKCRFFLWDEMNRHCSIGTTLPTGNAQLSLGGDTLLLYLPSFQCRTELGYQLQTTGPTILCLYLNQDAKNYQDAKTACEDRQGRLVKAETQEKINMITAFARDELNDYSRQFQLGTGLVRDPVKDIYVWPDGTTLAADSDLWNFREPSHDAYRTWGGIVTVAPALNDMPVLHSEQFVCEMD